METISTETRKMSSDLRVQYERWMEENERSRGTIRKYGYYLALFQEYLGGREITRREVIRWKEVLKGRFSPGTVNGALAAVNSLFAYCGWKGRICRSAVESGEEGLLREPQGADEK